MSGLAGMANMGANMGRQAMGMPTVPMGGAAAGAPAGGAPVFPGAAQPIPNPMPQMGAPEPAEVATNQLGAGVAAAAVIGVLLGCLLFRKGDAAADGDSDDDLESDDDSK